MTIVLDGQPGSSFVSGAFNASGQLIVTRADGTSAPLPGVVIVRATLVDNGDGSSSITFPEDD